MTGNANIASDALGRPRIDRQLAAWGSLVRVRSGEDERDLFSTRDRAELAR